MLLEINSTLVFFNSPCSTTPNHTDTRVPLPGRKEQSQELDSGSEARPLLLCGTAAAELGARQGGSAQSWAPGEALRLGWSALEAWLLSGFNLNGHPPPPLRPSVPLCQHLLTRGRASGFGCP